MTTATIDISRFEKIAFLLKTIAHPIRIAIVQLLIENESLSVNQICEMTDSEQSLISHHLSNMKIKGVFGSNRSGKNIYYHLAMKEVVQVLECMKKCEAMK